MAKTSKTGQIINSITEILENKNTNNIIFLLTLINVGNSPATVNIYKKYKGKLTNCIVPKNTTLDVNNMIYINDNIIVSPQQSLLVKVEGTIDYDFNYETE